MRQQGCVGYAERRVIREGRTRLFVDCRVGALDVVQLVGLLLVVR